MTVCLVDVNMQNQTFFSLTGSPSLGTDALPNGLDVTFEVTEIKRLTGSYNTMVGNNEGSMVREILAYHSCQSHVPQSLCPSVWHMQGGAWAYRLVNLVTEVFSSIKEIHTIIYLDITDTYFCLFWNIFIPQPLQPLHHAMFLLYNSARLFFLFCLTE